MCLLADSVIRPGVTMAVLKIEGAAHVRVTDFCACGLLEASDA